jgi:hypothetical protein
MLGNIINVLQASQQLGVAKRRQTLDELKYNRGVEQAVEVQGALKELQNYTAGNIHEAPADIIARVNPGTLSSMFATNDALRTGRAPSGSNVPAQIQVSRELVRQAGEHGGDFTATPIWQVITQGKSTKKTKEELREGLLKARANNPIYAAKGADALNEEVERDVDYILKGSSEGTSKRTKDPLLLQVLEDFEKAKKATITDELFSAHAPFLGE